jgi:hypothetical protein
MNSAKEVASTLDQVNDIDSAKELRDRIIVLQEGINFIQKSLYESAKTGIWKS